MLYLDNAATTPMRPEAVEALQSFADFGNPNGMHAISRAAKNAMEEAREQAAALIGAARPTEIVFTGGGTEADNLAVTGAYLARP
ncbi:MAG: aminotransferase class V-fold PLP-dependent enzyme, partial [Acidimicrobiia bacterium]|nr:aminotransferase class V-fold PLP-dependent enzyme [Acidimicrobiia bacterium]